jgi:hypothetical protein
MKTTIVACFALAVLLSGPFAARADDARTIQERLKAASASVHSVVIDMEMSPPGAAMPNMPRSINVLMTVAAPGRAKVVAVAGPLHIETYQVDGMLYMHVLPGDSWRKMSYDPTHPPTQVLDLIHAVKNEQFSLLPDSQEDGMTVGVVQISMQLPVPAGMASVGPPVTLTCNYDKETYHMRSCANATMSMTFAKYDDPSNTVDLPPGAATAVLIVTKTPAPAVTAPSTAPTLTPSPGPAIATPSVAPTITPSPAPTVTPSPAPSSTP